MSEASNPSLIDQVGVARLQTAVDDLFARAAADPVLSQWFGGADPVTLPLRFGGWLTGMLGGEAWHGPDIALVHQSMGIGDTQLYHFIAHLDESLRDAGVEPSLADEVIGRLAPQAVAVVSVWSDEADAATPTGPPPEPVAAPTWAEPAATANDVPVAVEPEPDAEFVPDAGLAPDDDPDDELVDAFDDDDEPETEVVPLTRPAPAADERDVEPAGDDALDLAAARRRIGDLEARVAASARALARAEALETEVGALRAQLAGEGYEPPVALADATLATEVEALRTELAWVSGERDRLQHEVDAHEAAEAVGDPALRSRLARAETELAASRRVEAELAERLAMAEHQARAAATPSAALLELGEARARNDELTARLQLAESTAARAEARLAAIETEGSGREIVELAERAAEAETLSARVGELELDRQRAADREAALSARLEAQEATIAEVGELRARLRDLESTEAALAELSVAHERVTTDAALHRARLDELEARSVQLSGAQARLDQLELESATQQRLVNDLERVVAENERHKAELRVELEREREAAGELVDRARRELLSVDAELRGALDRERALAAEVADLRYRLAATSEREAEVRELRVRERDAVERLAQAEASLRRQRAVEADLTGTRERLAETEAAAERAQRLVDELRASERDLIERAAEGERAQARLIELEVQMQRALDRSDSLRATLEGVRPAPAASSSATPSDPDLRSALAAASAEVAGLKRRLDPATADSPLDQVVAALRQGQVAAQSAGSALDDPAAARGLSVDQAAGLQRAARAMDRLAERMSYVQLLASVETGRPDPDRKVLRRLSTELRDVANEAIAATDALQDRVTEALSSTGAPTGAASGSLADVLARVDEVRAAVVAALDSL